MRPHMDDADEWELNVIEGASNLACTTDRKIGEAGTVKNANQQRSKVVQIGNTRRKTEIVQNEMKA